MIASTAARLVTWMDPHQAAAYTEVPVVQIVRAIRDHQLPATTARVDRPGVWMMRSSDLDLWTRWALGRATAAMSGPDAPI
jgi:hypothetical protein